MDYAFDTFVSYAHVDNEPPVGVGVAIGWVTALVTNLTILVNQRGIPDYKVWFDRIDLAGNVPVTAEVVNALGKSKTLLVILSPGYLKSPWCLQERNAFLAAVAERARSGARTFLVERENIELARRPDELRDVRAFKFYEPRPGERRTRVLGAPFPQLTDQAYFDRLTDLAYDLKDELDRLTSVTPSVTPTAKPCPPPSAVPAVIPSDRAVFLAEAPDDLSPERDDIRRYLKQRRVRVLPEIAYPKDLAEFRRCAATDLAKCTVFVQLLSGTVGDHLGADAQAYIRAQYECAQDLERLGRLDRSHILHWRSPDFDRSAVQQSDVRQDSLLGLDTVRAEGLEEFKREIARRLEPPPPPPPRRVYVYVDAEPRTNDLLIAQEVLRLLERHGLFPASAPQGVSPEAAEKDLEENLLTSSLIILVYGSALVDWVRHRLREFYKLLASVRAAPDLPIVAVWEGPPDGDRPPINMGWPFGLRYINCRQGVSEKELLRVLDDLLHKAPPRTEPV